MDKKAQIGKLLMDVAAFILFLIALMLFALIFNTCSFDTVDKRVTSVEFENFMVKTSFWTFKKTPVTYYDIETDISDALQWSTVLKSDRQSINNVLEGVFVKTGLYPIITVNGASFKFSNEVAKKSNIQSKSKWICTETKLNIPNINRNSRDIEIIPCYVVNTDQKKLKDERLKQWQEERIQEATHNMVD